MAVFSFSPLSGSNQGLSASEVQRRQQSYGENRLPEVPPPSQWQIVGNQFKSPLVYVLVVAAAVTFFLQEWADCVIILLAVTVNTVLGFIQEQKANQALFALKHHLPTHSQVIRDGQRQEVGSETLVPGDVVLLTAGTKIPADGQVLFSNRFFVNEAIMTGESVPVEKHLKEPVLMGTIVVSGQAIIEVTAIGAASKIGEIALKIQTVEADTPLQKQLKYFSQKLVQVVLAITLLTFALGLMTGKPWQEMFTTSVALAVSSIPEGLLISLTIILALGMQRILRQQGLVKKLVSAETLGGITVICSDKTGTLTEGQMQVAEVIGDKLALAKQVCIANDLDDPMVLAAYAWGETQVGNIANHYPRLDSVPFSSKNKYFVSLNQLDETSNLLSVNGAPEVLLKWTTVSATERQYILKQVETLTAQGKRVLAFVQQKLSKKITQIDEQKEFAGMTWVGLLAFDDPVRLSVKKSFKQAQHAGIRIVVITGDYAATARHVLQQLEIPLLDKQIMTGEELAQLSVEELQQRIADVVLFARTSPDQKMKIVTALKAQGDVVAMMGDGVNDAPALHQADIGIVVSDASDVAKESADLVLLDSNFQTVIAAIKEGRHMFDNIRKVIIYLLNDAFSEIVLVLGSLLLASPLPLSAVQILWINLISDGLPSLALTVDQSRSQIMTEKPRRRDELLITPWMLRLTAFISLFSGLATLSYFFFIWQSTGNFVLARSVAFISLGLDSLVYVFSIRDMHLPFWKTKIFANRWLVIAVLCGFLMQIIPFLFEPLRQFFGLTMPNFQQWLLASGLAILLFLFIEFFKWRFRHRHLSSLRQTKTPAGAGV